jgi:tetratricopeptide (TPR) repeat protein
MYIRLGEFAKAVEFLERGLSIARELGDRLSEGRAYGNLSVAYQGLGEFAKAVELFERDDRISLN